MTESIEKRELYRTLGFKPPFDELEQVLEDAGLSRPQKTGIAVEKFDRAERLLAARVVAVCSRGDCLDRIPEDGRVRVTALSSEFCAVCGGSANARSADQVVEALRRAGFRRLCIVGGSPASHQSLTELLGERLELRLVDGTGSRSKQQAKGDVEWADLLVVWGGTQLAHRISLLYRGQNVIQLARRGIGELAKEIVKAAERRA